ncbi:MAG: PAS domain S-box protein [Nitrospirae bacterium]|nr:PAS domain S-box protein [Nitrospirota bacterium]
MKDEKQKGQSDEIFRAVFENSLDAIGVSKSGVHVFVNPAYLSLFGYKSSDELTGRSILELIAPEERDKVMENVRRRPKGYIVPSVYETLGLRKDGTKFDMDVHVSSYEQAGEIYTLVILRDITERKKTEKNLYLNKYMIDHIQEMILWVDPEAHFVFVNDHTCRTLGYTREELLSMTVHDIDPNFPEEVWPQHWENIKQSGGTRTIETIVLHKNGRGIPIEVVINYLNFFGKEFHCCFVHDITERKLTEETIKAQIYFLQILLDAIPNPIFYKDSKGVYLGCNNAFESYIGLQKEQIIGKTVFDIAPKHLADIYHNADMELFNHPGTQTYESSVKYSDGSIHNVIFDKATFYDQHGTLQGLVDVITDITKRKNAEELLQESEERFRILLDQGFDGIFIHRDLIILDMNRRMADISGYSPSELLQSNVINLFTTDSQKRIHDYIRSGKGGYYEVELQRKDDRKVQIEAFGASCKFHGRNARIVAIRDITEQKKLQEQLRQAQKMEAIGHLAGGVAHDFNNILSAIVGYAHLTLMKMKGDDPLRMNLEQILASSERAANLTQSLLAFSRKQVMEWRAVNLNNIIFGMKKILDRVIGEDIEFKVNTTGHDLIIKADKGQIEQVLMNLATNARDAMPHGGVLTVTTEEVEIDEGFIQMNHFGETGRYAVISVADTGVGMDEKTRENIFEPFFTTKEVGKGTGLGLAMVYGTIKQHEGFINVNSEHSKGTTFNIYLPLAKSGVEHKGKQASAPDSSGNETILLVEDDKAVRMSTKALLEESGYTVIDAASGEHAVKLFRENKDLVQLVITDIIMPGKSGKDVYEELQKIRPDTKVLFISGYGADKLAKMGIIEKGINFMPKPLRPDDFSRKIREILDK